MAISAGMVKIEGINPKNSGNVGKDESKYSVVCDSSNIRLKLSKN